MKINYQLNISDEIEKITIFLTIIFYIFIYGPYESMFLTFSFKYTYHLFSACFIIILLTQIVFIIKIKDYILISWRLLFCFCISILIIGSFLTIYRINIIENKASLPKTEIYKLLDANGLTARRSAGYKFNGKFRYFPITEGQFQQIKKEDIDTYCVKLVYYSAYNGDLIKISEVIINCKEQSN